jgi:L-ascorbate metabolism protein UlaG (beta-lactamase superfamily)
MIITFHGAEFFKIQFGDTILATNPISKDSKIKGTRFGADVALVSLNHKDMNGTDQLSFGERQPFVISGPGEYETKGVFIKGWKSGSEYDGKKSINTLYKILMENMNLCFLGALDNDKSIPPDMLESMEEDIDILFVPIGGEGVLSADLAYKLAVKLEPKLIIPMHYGEVGEKDALKKFLKEAGEDIKPVDKLTLKKKDLEGKEGDVAVLSQI